MKAFKKIMALVIAIMLVAGMNTVFADPDPVPEANTGKITINNTVKGETYTIYKLFDAEVGANGAIIYRGDIPDSLKTYFTKNASDEISATADAKNGDKLSDNAQAALKTWASTAQVADSKAATDNTVAFSSLPFGYYVITSTAADPSVIMVTSTDPEATVYEKNEKVPQPDKTVDDHTYSIGDTIPYKVTFPGINFKGTGEDAEVVTRYIVTDTLPAFLSNVTVTGIKIGGEEKTVSDTNFPGVTTFGSTRSFEIPWATYDSTAAPGQRWTSLYTNGSVVEITYTAVLTDIVNIGGVKNINTVTITRKTGKDTGEEEPTDEEWHDEEYVYTYGAALEKVDSDKKPLAGAKFKVTGLTAVETVPGVYTVSAYRPSGDNAISLENSTEMTVNSDGMLYIVGLQEALTLTITETEAPTSYNKLTNTESLTTQVINEGTLVKKIDGYRKYDAKGNLIEESETVITGVDKTDADLTALTTAKIQVTNNKGTELPETGGMGTTILYIIGALLLVGAGVLLVTRKRMAK